MQYVTSFERIGMEKGRQQGIVQGMQQGIQQGILQGQEKGQLEQSRLAVIDVLTVRFQSVPIPLVNQIAALRGDRPAASLAPAGGDDSVARGIRGPAARGRRRERFARRAAFCLTARAPHGNLF